MPLGPSSSPSLSLPKTSAFSSSSASLDLFFVLVLIVTVVVLVVVGVRCDSLWKAHGILLLLYMESTREAHRACTMQMIPRYGLFIVSHLRVYTRSIHTSIYTAAPWYVIILRIESSEVHGILRVREKEREKEKEKERIVKICAILLYSSDSIQKIMIPTQIRMRWMMWLQEDNYGLIQYIIYAYNRDLSLIFFLTYHLFNIFPFNFSL